MKILGLIPARGGSKGIPGKNIKMLGSKPLLQYTFEAAESSELLNKVILSSDDEDIIHIAKQLELEVPFKRPDHLAEDSTSSLEVVKHAVNYYLERGIQFDAVCLLQVTTPCRKPGLIDECILKFQDNNFDSLVSVREVPEDFNPHWIFEENNGSLKIATGEEKIISRRQDLPKAYHRDGAIYLTKTEVLLNENSLFGKKIGFVNTSASPYVNIDTPEDWKKAEEMLSKLKS
ncbi:acylneuraminate cytidylyltransferase [Salegentibacter salinarum]|uniref:Acylneuraminate cytidylyltransferase n=1 Tax=Salegentibacter salinarum TaxID=447422 RepID=A0A2N0U2B0_9FLAO|nr:acylneuraminate cytidylyltransferase family protein [Salegentibacter salinarum]PKD21119.1 acylneuraminate cytidylyltransferase [Salegentibacter salinarum]SKB76141.1 N-acylneuraminate cytidylyltransferase [Salegentibacter salinarum]